MSQMAISGGHTDHITEAAIWPVTLQQCKILQMAFLLLWILCFALSYLCITMQTTSIKTRTEQRCDVCGVQVMENKVLSELDLISMGMKPFISHFHLSQPHPGLLPLWNCCFMSDDLCSCMRSPLRVPFELSFYKNMFMLLQTVGSALVRPHWKHKQ